MGKLSGNFRSLKLKPEKIIFGVLVLLNCLPILLSKYVVTMDGAAHLGNATLIHDLLVHGNSVTHDFYQFNPVPVPNWSGHFLLVLLKLIFPGYLAEKVLLLAILIGLSYGFRYLIKQLNPNGILISYWILPFSYHILFILGFYNFDIALVLLFWVLGYWHSTCVNPFSWKKTSWLGFLFLALFFSHVFIFGVALLLAGGIILIQNKREKATFSTYIKRLFPSILTLLIAVIPSLILLFIYLQFGQGSSEKVYLSREELFNWIRNLQPLIAYDFYQEIPFVKKFTYLLFVLILVSFYQKFKQKKKNNTPFFNKNDSWFLVAFVLLTAYFTLPDITNNAGFISIRLLLLTFLFTLIWIATQPIPVWITFLLIIPVIGLQTIRIKQFNQIIRTHNQIALSVEKATQHIKSNTVVLPINHSNHWLFGHLSNYLLADKPLIVLENYEANMSYFPLYWNDKNFPNLTLDTLRANSIEIPCASWRNSTTKTTQPIDYVFVLGTNPDNLDSCNSKFLNYIQTHFTRTFHDDHVILYRKK